MQRTYTALTEFTLTERLIGKAKALRKAVLPWPVPEWIYSDARMELIRILKALHAQEDGE